MRRSGWAAEGLGERWAGRVGGWNRGGGCGGCFEGAVRPARQRLVGVGGLGW
ncbi:MAG: hypothetical protein QOI83_825 [Streptomycetaceae bacterium]|nr:hypothetical protein [Streptomycetaceae bacterium]